MLEFNKVGRSKNVLKASLIGVISYVLTLVLSFVFRTVFLNILTKEYLGLNGLFSDILSLLSLADLGISGAIVYRLYAPIAADEIGKVSAVMNYFKNVYRIIALIITVIGCAIMPFIKFFIKDASDVPTDINIYVIYVLFLIQTVSTYLFAYKQSLLGADQRNDVLSIFSIFGNFVKYGVQILILVLAKKYIWCLVSGIVATIAVNFVQSLIVSHRYKEVFSDKKARLTKEERKKIMYDTRALMLHKIGSVVLSSTDAIVITTFVGLGINGIYANYVLIISAIKLIIRQLISPLTASVGNLYSTGDIEKCEQIFYRLQFVLLWINTFCSVALFSLINPFIEVWQGKEFLLSVPCVIALVFNFFILEAREVGSAYIGASGLFNKDRIRPLIEAGLNLGISIFLAIKIGIVGVFIGTGISCLLTATWREPYLIFKHIFKKRQVRYWIYYIIAFVITVGLSAFMYYICSLMPNTVGYLFAKFAIVIVVPNLIIIAMFFWTKEFKYFYGQIKDGFVLIKRKIVKKANLGTKIEESDADNNIQIEIEVNKTYNHIPTETTQCIIDEKESNNAGKSAETSDLNKKN